MPPECTKRMPGRRPGCPLVTEDRCLERVSLVPFKHPFLAADASPTDQRVHRRPRVGHTHEVDQVAGDGWWKHSPYDRQTRAELRVEGGPVPPCRTVHGLDAPQGALVHSTHLKQGRMPPGKAERTGSHSRPNTDFRRCAAGGFWERSGRTALGRDRQATMTAGSCRWWASRPNDRFAGRRQARVDPLQPLSTLRSRHSSFARPIALGRSRATYFAP
jgi:hypothetical protein